jgi:hypothetical protein
MPEISRFYGIVIGMFFDDHPPSHFHVRYGDHQAVVRINDLMVSEGTLPPRTLGLVVEWAAKHRTELLRNWNAIASGRPIRKIAPLE